MIRPTTLERAFELARSGKYTTLSELREALVAEDFNTAQLAGPSLRKQIRRMCVDAGKGTQTYVNGSQPT
jgi:hypothetical protein